MKAVLFNQPTRSFWILKTKPQFFISGRWCQRWLPALVAGFALLAQAQTAPNYQEIYRPQFHFSSQSNWLNDPAPDTGTRRFYRVESQAIP